MRYFSCLLAVLMLAIPSAVWPQTPSPAPSPSRPSMRQRWHIPTRANVSHPEVRSAVRSLQLAKKMLERAQANKPGHRDHAMKLVDQAIGQCQQILQADHK